MVEYWSRGQYINLDAHADIDENTLKEEGVLRCPKHGHVLYLQIANSKENTVASDGDGVDATIAAMTDEEKQVRMGPTCYSIAKWHGVLSLHGVFLLSMIVRWQHRTIHQLI